eukprot:TRINITY_DN6130_c0_g1_i1.p1 TRINITY_DN6130_c0_g1~~TRINITY_DN6130_c0_g1_i1.p1  ORF type:complete len:422 (+),score=78.61 TRINITY_DN6130_c0_g1_i1:89-1354(+)
MAAVAMRRIMQNARGIHTSAVCRGHDPFSSSPDVRRKQASQFIYSMVIARHGDRTPKHHYPNWKLPEDGPLKYAQLTPLGEQQMLRMGQYYRDLFDKRGIPLDPEQVFARSTASTRCKLSAEVFLRGMFGHEKSVNVHTIPLEVDTLLKRHRQADFDSLKKEVYANPEWSAYQDLHEEDLRTLSDVTGAPIALKDVNHVQSYLHYLKIHNLEMPKGVTEDIIRATDDMAAFVRRAKFTTRPAAVIAGTNLVKDIARRLESLASLDAAQQARPIGMQYKHIAPLPRFVLYCAHNGTLITLLAALGIRQPMRMPQYASHVRVELWRDRNTVASAPTVDQYSVRLWYDQMEAAIPWSENGGAALRALLDVAGQLDTEYGKLQATLGAPLKPAQKRLKSEVEMSKDIAAEFEAITYVKKDPYAGQ